MKSKAKAKASRPKCGDDWTPDEWDAHTEFQLFTQLAADALGYTHPLVAEMREANEGCDGAGRPLVNFERLAELRAWLLTLPPALLDKIFKGWKPQPKRLTRREFDNNDARQIQRCLIFTLREGHRQQHISAGIEHELNDYPCNVRVAIREGTSKTRAVTTLLRVLAFIDAAWEKLIVTDDDFIDFPVPDSATMEQ